MKIGLLLNSNNELCSYSKKYLDILVENDIPYMLIDPNSDLFPENIKTCTHLLFRHSQGDTDKIIYELVFNIAHNIYQIKCFPNFETYWPYEDKVKEYYLLKLQGFPIIRSYPFWNYTQAEAFLKKADFPIVAKLPKGAGSSNVVIVNSINEGKKIIRQVFTGGVKNQKLNVSSNLQSLSKVGIFKYMRSLFRSKLISTGFLSEKIEYPEWQIQKDSILFQDYLPNNTFDIRVTVIGNRGFAFRRLVRKNDFRASGSGILDMDPEKIDKKCLESAFTISKKLKFDTMAYDFIYDESGEPWINEISYCFVDKAVYNCTGYWDEKLIWHPGQLWPQHCQLEDFLEIKLKSN